MLYNGINVRLPSVSKPLPENINVQPSGPTEPEPITFSTRTPDDYLCWSIFSIVCCNPCCLGWLALYFSLKTRSETEKLLIDSAADYSKKAKTINTVLLVIGIIVLALYMTAVVIIATNPDCRNYFTWLLNQLSIKSISDTNTV